ncbi:MAG: hypothetical protein OXE46_12445 [Chloroflexi bacterium]|nr:hypothetical protein [Chloroflexota bacterium]
MPTLKPSPTAPVPRQRDDADLDELTDAQIEFLEDLRVSLIQMKNGDVMPALEALREIEREIEQEENGSRPDA